MGVAASDARRKETIVEDIKIFLSLHLVATENIEKDSSG
jgi:hypothetical protein